MVDKVRTKIKDDAFWDSEMTSNMASLHNIERFTIYDNILPIYERFCRKLNQYSYFINCGLDHAFLALNYDQSA